MTVPIRVQRKRTKGWKMPPNTVYVGRPSIWGNPFLIDAEYMPWLSVGLGNRGDKTGCRETSVALFRAWLTGENMIKKPLPDSGDIIEFAGGARRSTSQHVQGMALGFAGLFAPATPIPPKPSLDALRGKNLACFCSLGLPCHADVLLEVANR